MTTSNEGFGERMAEVLGKDPTYYQLLVSKEPSRRMWDLVESLALEGDPEQPEMALSLFQELSAGVPEEQAERWLAGLRDAARRIYRKAPQGGDTSLADTLMRLVYADPNVYELFASVEPGYGLLETVESLALEGDTADIETMLHLMRELADEAEASVV